MKAAVYQERFPNRCVPCPKTFANIEHRLRDNGSFEGNQRLGHRWTVRIANLEENVLQMVEDTPSINSRSIAWELGTSKSTINRVTIEELFVPYHIKRPVQYLLLADFAASVTFCEIVRQKNQLDLNYSMKILFTDEKCFTGCGATNTRNEQVYALENPHTIKRKHFQHQFKINIWIGIINNFLVGRFRLPNPLDGDFYLNFLQNHLLNSNYVVKCGLCKMELHRILLIWSESLAWSVP